MDKIIAVDFDGTLVENAWPEIGRPRWDVIDRLKEEQKEGAKTILWTCRTGKQLAEAIFWCLRHGIVFDAVNRNLPERVEQFGGDPRKISATEYWDDRAIHI